MAQCTAIVPRGPSVVCAGCQAGPETPWAQYSVTRNSAGQVLQKAPVGQFCQDCGETILEAARPGQADLQAAADDGGLLESLPALRARRHGEPSLHEKHSVEVVTRHCVTWREQVEAVDAQKLRQTYGSGALLRAGVTVQSVTDLAGVDREVVFCRPQGGGHRPPTGGAGVDRPSAGAGNSPGVGSARPVGPTVEISTTTETIVRKHLLRPETHLREGQAAEWVAQVAATQAAAADRNAPVASRAARGELEARLQDLTRVPVAGQAGTAQKAQLGDTEELQVCVEGLGGSEGPGGGVAPTKRRTAHTSGDAGTPAKRRLLRKRSSGECTPARQLGTRPRPRPETPGSGSRRGRGQASPGEGRKKDLPNFDELTVEELLGHTVKNVRETLWHQKQRMPGLKKSLDKDAYDTLEEKLEALLAAERLGPEHLLQLEEGEVASLIGILLAHTGWGACVARYICGHDRAAECQGKRADARHCV